MRHKKKQQDSVTFRIVAASRDDPNDVQLNFQRVVTQNDIKKGRIHKVPDDVLNAFKPEDFGIHSKLDTAQKEVLCQQIYGSPELPEELRLSDDDEKVHDTVLSDGDTDAILSDANEDDIDQIKLLPNDGYDYGQHLRPIGGKGGLYIPSTEPQVYHMPEPKNTEERELFEAIENAELYDEIEDEFADILGSPVPSDNEQEEIVQQETEVDPTAIQHNDIFSKTMAEYGDDDIGDICEVDANLISGANNVDDFDELLDEFLQDDNKRFLYLEDDEDEGGDVCEEEDESCNIFMQKNEHKKDKVTQMIQTLDKDDAEIIRKLVQRQMEDSRDTEPSDIEEEPRDEWDIETILTTKTNIYNHPGKIANPSVRPTNRIILPMKVKELMKVLHDFDEEKAKSKVSEEKSKEDRGKRDILRSVNTIPTPNETPEQRRERKKAVKEARRAVRIMKKENKQLEKKERRPPTLSYVHATRIIS